MKLENIEQGVTKTGTTYKKLTIDGKNYNWFNELDIPIGSDVECDFEKNGIYTNLKDIRLASNIPQKAVVTEARHDIVLTRTEKPHSYEFGKASARHKIYYGEIGELILHMKALKELGYIEDEEIGNQDA